MLQSNKKKKKSSYCQWFINGIFNIDISCCAFTVNTTIAIAVNEGFFGIKLSCLCKTLA